MPHMKAWERLVRYVKFIFTVALQLSSLVGSLSEKEVSSMNEYAIISSCRITMACPSDKLAEIKIYIWLILRIQQDFERNLWLLCQQQNRWSSSYREVEEARIWKTLLHLCNKSKELQIWYCQYMSRAQIFLDSGKSSITYVTIYISSHTNIVN